MIGNLKLIVWVELIGWYKRTLEHSVFCVSFRGFRNISVFLSASLSMSKKCVLLFIHLLISQFFGL